MHWDDAAIILSARKFGESSAVIRVLAREHGVYGGVMRGAMSKANRGVAAPGNVISAHWNARLSEQLGTLKLELLEPHAAHIMADAGKLAALASACSLVELAMPERHPYPKLFAALHSFLHHLQNDDWPEEYVKFELALLAESGFGLDLSECAATGIKDDLIYVSPKSARAVSREAGEPYREKLLPLPSFLLPPPERERAKEYQETLAGLRLSGYFLEHSLLGPHGKKLPAARARLVDYMKEQHG